MNSGISKMRLSSEQQIVFITHIILYRLLVVLILKREMKDN